MALTSLVVRQGRCVLSRRDELIACVIFCGGLVPVLAGRTDLAARPGSLPRLRRVSSAHKEIDGDLQSFEVEVP